MPCAYCSVSGTVSYRAQLSMLVQTGNVCNFDLYRPVWAVHTGPSSCRYVDRPLSGSSAKNRPSAVDFGRRRSIEGEFNRRCSIEQEKGKKKKRKRRKKEKRRKNT
ncbi:hypothetical protein BHM03_00046597 [Ensete ventricosum]|nr:hypothetical protein BHM03_00046597 [Ensete ventricosum]